MDPRLAPALREMHRLLVEAKVQIQSSLRFALLGGLAVSAWGVIRATQDIDFLANSDPTPLHDLGLRDKLKQFMQQNSHADWRVGDHDDPIPLLLRIELPPTFGNVGADIIWAHKRWQREALQRSIGVDVDGTEIPVLHPEDLILSKLEAGGPQDFLDAEELLSAAPAELNIMRLKEIAARLRLGKALDKCLRNARKGQ